MSATKTSARATKRPDPMIDAPGRQTLKVVEPEDLASLVARTKHLDDEQATAWIVDQLRAMEDGYALIFPAIRHYLVLCRRANVRKTERAVVRQFTPGDGTRQAVSHVTRLTLSQLATVKDDEVFFPSIGKARAGAAKIADWESRDSMLAKQERGIAESRSYGRAVIRALRSYGADCIDQALKEGKD